MPHPVNSAMVKPVASMSRSQERTIRLTVAVSDLAFCRTSWDRRTHSIVGQVTLAQGVSIHRYEKISEHLTIQDTHKLFSKISIL